jgi:hypothetical protein
MTQAFNLSQLANNLNTSGQLDATDGLSGVVPVANGGTGQSSLTANNVILGNGTSGVQVVAPTTSGNVLTANGTTWQSSVPNTTSASRWVTKAWINFDGLSGGVVRDSYGISTLTKITDGIWEVTFTTAFANANYSVTGTLGWTPNANNIGVTFNAPYGVAPTTTTMRFSTGTPAGTVYNPVYVYGQWFG